VKNGHVGKRTAVVLLVLFVVFVSVFLYLKTMFSRPNIVFISIDALRPDHLGCYGYKRNTSYHIDALAKKGTIFLNCFSTSTSTAYSSVGLVTGRYLMVAGSDDAQGMLDAEFLTLPERLKQFGYYNFAFLSNGHYSEGSGFERGFDSYQNYLETFGTAEKMTDEIIRSLKDRDGKKPFFIWAHYIDPHAPYYSEPEEFTRIFEKDELQGYHNKKLAVNPDRNADSGISAGYIPRLVFNEGEFSLDYYITGYDTDIFYTDFHIGRLLKELPRNTVVIITADHGESLGEHNVYFSHGENIHDELLHIPLIISDGRFFKGNKKIETIVSAVDIVPTILERVNPLWYFFHRKEFDGLALAAAANNRQLKRQYIYSYDPSSYAIRDTKKNIKYILYKKGNEELYFLPDEIINVIAFYPQEAAALRDHLKVWRQRYPLRSDIHASGVALGQRAKENLRSLGYAQ